MWDCGPCETQSRSPVCMTHVYAEMTRKADLRSSEQTTEVGYRPANQGAVGALWW